MKFHIVGSRYKSLAQLGRPVRFILGSVSICYSMSLKVSLGSNVHMNRSPREVIIEQGLHPHPGPRRRLWWKTAAKFGEETDADAKRGREEEEKGSEQRGEEKNKREDNGGEVRDDVPAAAEYEEKRRR